METGKNTSADRNRKQTGKSEEIVADSAICTCDKGSKPGTFRVTSQQKIYCNGARKLVATDQDKDIKSLNFGSCAAKNNGPCSPNIVWSNTYNKIAIKGKMYPLTVKSSGTCKAGGGRINIQTSGQQVVVKPSSSPHKANSTAHKSPVFTEEDWKHLPQEDEKGQNKRVPAAVQVNNVLVNGKREITITPYDQEELLFTTSLTAGSMRGTGVKWDVCHGNLVIAKGLTEAPARTYFTKEGTYSVYAYVHKPGSPKGKGVVTITVSYPKFKSIEWKDENGKPVTYIGLRNKVFAHVSLPGCKGIPVNCRFYYNGYEGKTYLSALTPITLSAAGKVKIALSLSSDQLKKIKEDRKRFSNGQKIRIYLELSSRHWIENLTKVSQHPILFNDTIEFRSLIIYKDSDCKEKLQGGIADSGSIVYVRVSTANMETGKIRLDVYKHETGNQEEKSPKPSPVYSTSCPVNSTGVYKFSLTLAAPPYKEGTAYKVIALWAENNKSIGDSSYNSSWELITIRRKLPESPNNVSLTNIERNNASNCEGKYCLKKGDKGKLIEEINIRLAGFGGCLPSDEFTELTEKCVRQFQRDYMQIEPTGVVCGSFLVALDDLRSKYSVDFNRSKCNCGDCKGFGNQLYLSERGNSKILEMYRKYEYPGIHRSLWWALKAVMFYLANKEQNMNISLLYINSGYRCHKNNRIHGRTSTNHMGKAMDLHFYHTNDKHKRQIQNNKTIEEIRSKIFHTYLKAGYDWKINNIFNLESTRMGAPTWVHFDVRTFDLKYLSDYLFANSLQNANGPTILEYAKSLDKGGICNCIKSSLPANKPTTSNNIKKDFDLSDAREALQYIYNTYGRDMAIIIERMFRGETAHFASVQYKKCGTCGMEAHGDAPYYGWDSNFFEKYLEYKPVGIYEMYESKGLSGKGGNAQDTSKPKKYIIMPSVKATMEYLVYYIRKHNNNYARWHSTKASAQEAYRSHLQGIVPRIVKSFEK